MKETMDFQFLKNLEIIFLKRVKNSSNFIIIGMFEICHING